LSTAGANSVELCHGESKARDRRCCVLDEVRVVALEDNNIIVQTVRDGGSQGCRVQEANVDRTGRNGTEATSQRDGRVTAAHVGHGSSSIRIGCLAATANTHGHGHSSLQAAAQIFHSAEHDIAVAHANACGFGAIRSFIAFVSNTEFARDGGSGLSRSGTEGGQCSQGNQGFFH